MSHHHKINTSFSENTKCKNLLITNPTAIKISVNIGQIEMASHSIVVETSHYEPQILTWMMALEENSEINKVSGIHLLGSMNVCAKYHLQTI